MLHAHAVRWPPYVHTQQHARVCVVCMVDTSAWAMHVPRGLAWLQQRDAALYVCCVETVSGATHAMDSGLSPRPS
jgi:hypothetical protein